MACVHGRDLERPSGLAFVARVLDVVVRRVDLVGADQRVVATAVLRSEAPRVERPRVEARLALDDPLGHQFAHATGSGDAVRAEAGRHPEARDRALAEDELAVGREGLRTVDQRSRSQRPPSAGTREIAASKSGAKRSQSGLEQAVS